MRTKSIDAMDGGVSNPRSCLTRGKNRGNVRPRIIKKRHLYILVCGGGLCYFKRHALFRGPSRTWCVADHAVAIQSQGFSRSPRTSGLYCQCQSGIIIPMERSTFLWPSKASLELSRNEARRHLLRLPSASASALPWNLVLAPHSLTHR